MRRRHSVRSGQRTQSVDSRRPNGRKKEMGTQKRPPMPRHSWSLWRTMKMCCTRILQCCCPMEWTMDGAVSATVASNVSTSRPRSLHYRGGSLARVCERARVNSLSFLSISPDSRRVHLVRATAF